MLTASENRAFDAWLCRLSARCERLSGRSLDDVNDVIESAGCLPEPGLKRLLWSRWSRGAAVGPSAGWLLEIVRRQCDAVADDEAGPLDAAADLMIAAADRCEAAAVGNLRQVAAAAALPAQWREVHAARASISWASFLLAIDSGVRAAVDLEAAERQRFAADSAALWEAA